MAGSHRSAFITLLKAYRIGWLLCSGAAAPFVEMLGNCIATGSIMHTFLIPPLRVVQACGRAYIPEAAPGNCQSSTVQAGMLGETMRRKKLKNGQKGRLQHAEAFCRETGFCVLLPSARHGNCQQMPRVEMELAVPYVRIDVLRKHGKPTLTRLLGRSAAIGYLQKLLPRVEAPFFRLAQPG